MGKFRNFFTPQRMGFHIVLAILITVVLAAISLYALKLYTRHGQEVEMPNFIGQNSIALIDTLLPSDYIIVIEKEIYEKNVEPGTILKQNPEAGEMVKKGRKIYLTVAASEPETVFMPKLVERDGKDGVTLSQAKIMLAALELEIGDIFYVADTVSYDRVVGQYYKNHPIESGAPIKKGEKINLMVTRLISELPTGADSLRVEE